MKLDVLFFASYRELVGTDRLQVEVPSGGTVDELVELVRGQGEDFGSLPPRVAVAVNHTVVGGGHVLVDGDEVAFLPPVAGG
jgi:molybdopterin synthase sulfur carrier subunit